jgi:hypothetical protein
VVDLGAVPHGQLPLRAGHGAQTKDRGSGLLRRRGAGVWGAGPADR